MRVIYSLKYTFFHLFKAQIELKLIEEGLKNDKTFIIFA